MAWNPKSMRLWQEIALTLSFKTALLIIIWAAFFSGPRDVPIDAQQASSHIFSQQPAKEQHHDADTGTR